MAKTSTRSDRTRRTTVGDDAVPAKLPRTRAAAKTGSAPKRKPAAKSKAKPEPKRVPRQNPAGAERLTKTPSVRRSASSAKAPADRDVKHAARSPEPHEGRAAEPAESALRSARTPRGRSLTSSERDRRFNLILQTACLKAGSAAAVTAITSKIPLLGRLAPVLVGSVTETMALGRIQQQLVRDTLDLYDLQLSELEERGVILLASAGNLGAQQLSRQMVEQLTRQLGGRYLKLIASRALPLAGLVGEIAGAIASTYTVGKRAQVLCNLPGTGARNLGELLRGMTGIDQKRLLSWSVEALKLSLAPFRSVLALLPGGR